MLYFSFCINETGIYEIYFFEFSSFLKYFIKKCKMDKTSVESPKISKL